MTNSSVDIRLEAVRAAQALLPDKVADLLAYAREIETYLRGEETITLHLPNCPFMRGLGACNCGVRTS